LRRRGASFGARTAMECVARRVDTRGGAFHEIRAARRGAKTDVANRRGSSARVAAGAAIRGIRAHIDAGAVAKSLRGPDATKRGRSQRPSAVGDRRGGASGKIERRRPASEKSRCEKDEPRDRTPAAHRFASSS
jgi:hypothetical protein